MLRSTLPGFESVNRYKYMLALKNELRLMLKIRHKLEKAEDLEWASA